jgi:hypothetical protein
VLQLWSRFVEQRCRTEAKERKCTEESKISWPNLPPFYHFQKEAVAFPDDIMTLFKTYVRQDVSTQFLDRYFRREGSGVTVNK